MKQNICIFCEIWESGGIESFWSNLLLHMDLRDFSLDIVAAELRESIFTKRLMDAGVHFFELSGKIHRFDDNYRLFVELINRRHYDIIHINAYHAMSLFYAYLGKRAGVPVRIVHSHNTALRASPTKHLKLLLHRFYRRHYTESATDLWACSKDAADFLFDRKALEKRKYRFVPNAIDVERFRMIPDIRNRVRRELSLEDKYVVGNVGRLCMQKNQSFLIDVFAELVQKIPKSVLLIVGDGEDRKRLEERASALQLAENVIFYGTSAHIEELFGAMDVFVFPSVFEGFGIVAVEAKAAGLPVLCSEAVPTEAVCAAEATVLSLADGPAVWSQRLEEYFPGRDARDRAQAVINEDYNIDHLADTITFFYQNHAYEKAE